MFELIILKKGKYRNEVLTYEYSSIYNLMKELNKWLENGTVKENEIFNIRYVNE